LREISQALFEEANGKNEAKEARGETRLFTYVKYRMT
jgi:hypothetical protein